MDYMMSPKWRFMGRYTHDLSETTEPGGLFFNTAIPDVATTLTDVPGQVFVGQVTTTLSSSTFNELSLQFSSNAITSEYGENVTNTRDDLGITISELFPENREGLIPFQVFPGGIASIGANQLFDNKYTNLTIAENLTHARGAHQWKGGFLIAMEAKDELSTSATQGTFNWRAGGGRTAFQNFLTGNRDGLCGANCDYVEPEREIALPVPLEPLRVLPAGHLERELQAAPGPRPALLPAARLHGRERPAHQLRARRASSPPTRPSSPTPPAPSSWSAAATT